MTSVLNETCKSESESRGTSKHIFPDWKLEWNLRRRNSTIASSPKLPSAADRAPESYFSERAPEGLSVKKVTRDPASV